MNEIDPTPEFKRDPSELFDSQVEAYIEHGYNAIVFKTQDEFRESLSQLRAVALRTYENNKEKYENTDMPLMIAIPEWYVGLNDQLGLTGSRAFLEPSEMHNTDFRVLEPLQPYVLFGVDIGEEVSDLSPETVQNQLGDERNGLRLNELINLSLHVPAAWQKFRGLYAIATVHIDPKQQQTIVDLYRYGDGGLKVKRDPAHINDPEWTTPTFIDYETADVTVE